LRSHLYRCRKAYNKEKDTILCACSHDAIYAQALFYQGKTITVVVSRDAGGGSDVRIKALIPFL